MSMVVHGQNDSIRNSYIHDFNTFVHYLEETHPDPYSVFGGKINFKYKTQTIRNQIEQDTINISQFREILTSFIAQLEDGHTFINSSITPKNQQPEKYFPIVFKVAVDGLFIETASKEYSQHIGSKLLAINNISVDKLLQEIRLLGGIENEYGAMYSLRNRIANQNNAEKLLGSISTVELELQNTKDEVYNLNVNYNAHPDWNVPESKVEINKDNPWCI